MTDGGSGGGGGDGSASGGGDDGGNPVTPGDDGSVSGPPGTLAYWTTGIRQKVQPTTAAGSSTSITTASAREAWSSAQIVVHGQGGNLQGVTVSADDLSDGAGHTIPKSNITFFREYFIDFTGVKAVFGNEPVPSKSPTSDPKLPDPLIPLVDPYTGANAGQPFNVEPNTNQPLWVDIYAPKGTVAGTYTSKIHLTSTGGQASDVPLSVTVWNLDLPDLRTVTAYFSLNINPLYFFYAGLAVCSSGGTNCYLDTNAAVTKMVDRFEDLAHTHRLDVGWARMNYPIANCAVGSDWSQFDALANAHLTGSKFSDGIPSARIDSPFSPGQMGTTCTSAQTSAKAAAVSAHMKANNWWSGVYSYAYDEPPSSVYPQITSDSQILQAGDPDWKSTVLVTTGANATSTPILNPGVGIYVINLKLYDSWNYQSGSTNYGRATWPQLFSQGIKLWFYESNSVVPPYPTFSNNTLDGLEPMMAMWGSWFEKATGFLYWDMTSWDLKAPWGPTISYGLAGDGVLIYPGNHNGTKAPSGSPSDITIDGPIPSYRLKVIRNGLQDWALFQMADKKNLTSQVQSQFTPIYSQLGGCTYQGCPAPAGGYFWKTDEATMDSIRQSVAQAIIAAP